MSLSRKKGKSTSSVGHWFGGNWKWLVPLAVVGILVGSFWGPISSTVIGWFGGSTAPPPPTGQFSVVAWDAPRNLALPEDSFNYTLWGVTGNDLTDFGNFDELDASDSLGDLRVADLDTDYDHWVLRAAGCVVAGDWDTDDAAVIDEIDTTYDHYYYDRYFVLSATSKNTLMFYETPSDGNFQVVDSQSFDAITNMHLIVAQRNVTLFAGTNMSQPFAKYVSGENYPNETPDTPAWIVTANTTISMSWLSMNGAVKTRINDTALKFTFGVLGPVPSMFNLIWNNNDAADILINSIQLVWSDATIAIRT
jgi:hypothetical protein